MLRRSLRDYKLLIKERDMHFKLKKFLAAAVKAGASFMDVLDIAEDKEPKWYWKTSVPALRMENNYACILGQNFGNFHCPVNLTIDRATKINLGFDIPVEADHLPVSATGSEPEAYSYLTELWLDEIWSRRANVLSS
jgi:hypothetical protein